MASSDSFGFAMNAEERLADLGIELPPAPPPPANFLRTRLVGNFLYLSGHGPRHADGGLDTGTVGAEIKMDAARASARLTGLNMLASARQALGSLDRVRQVIDVFALVNSAPGFNRQPEVVDAFSDLMVDVFGEAGRHTRMAVGTAELPFGMTLEIKMIFDVDAPGH